MGETAQRAVSTVEEVDETMRGYNQPMSTDISLGIFDLVGVIMLVLSGTSLIYLLRVENKSRSSLMLLGFFVCIILSSIATIITNIGTAWDWAFAPSQDALIILGGLFLVRFAYLFPQDDQPREGRWVFSSFSILAISALVYALSFAIRYIANLPGDLAENQAFYLVTPVAVFLVVIIFFRRSIHWSSQVKEAKSTGSSKPFPAVKFFLRPANRSAVALRNYGLSVAVSLIPVVITVGKGILPGILESFLFNFGVVIAIAAVMLTYLNYAPEPVTISAKLLGISLVSVLLVLGLAGIWIYQANPGLNEHDLVLTFILLVLLSSLLIAFIFPYFYRTALLNPLDKLLGGVKAANEGDLNVQVDVQYDDEIGFLTQSFNRMVGSLKDLTYKLENRAIHLEQEVNDRTAEITKKNAQLEGEIREREIAEEKLSQQLLFQQSLAGCSQSLLLATEDKNSQEAAVEKALEYLRSGAQASRAYIHRNFDDAELGRCTGILAEVCADGILPHITIPINLRFPLSRLPAEMVKTLENGMPFGGPVKKALVSTPEIVENFLNQVNPLLSFILFPIFNRGYWWGYVGFDDCITEREWTDIEISMLRTASEMIGNSLQRWQIENQLRETLEDLEMRVHDRTAALSEEIKQRQRIQQDIEIRLRNEAKLAAISTRLLEPARIRQNIMASLEDLALMINSERVFLIEFDAQITNQYKDYYEWHALDVTPLTEDGLLLNLGSWIALRDRLHDGNTIYLDVSVPRSGNELDLSFLKETGEHSYILSPIVINQRVQAILGCIKRPELADDILMYLRSIELVAGMLKSLLQREGLIQTLEEQVAERTRQLTTLLDMAMLREQAQDLADLLQPTLLSITQIASCDAAGIHILHEDKSRLELIAARGIPIKFLPALKEIEIDDQLATWLVHGNLSRSTGDPGINFPDSFCIPGYGAFTANRLSAGEKTLGLLGCYRIDDQPFSSFQTALLTALGELLGIIVENYRLRIEAGELAALEERQRLAREIHDAVSQSVYSLSLFARSAQDALDDGNQNKLIASLRDIEATALLAMREMRLLLYQLREVRQDGDLTTALESRFKQVENRLGIQVTHEVGADIVLPALIRHEVWRIIIEALNNVVKHANASQVHIQISCRNRYFIANIEDDGIGFENMDASSGMGLKNMQVRAEKLGGNLVIASRSGQGTQVTLEIPMACTNQDEGD